jgi:sec-independent protein translocase protein TatA
LRILSDFAFFQLQIDLSKVDVWKEDRDMVGPFGGWEIIIILLIVLIIFGPTKLPQMGQAMGKAIKEFKKAGKELRSDVTLDEEEDEGKGKSK